MAVVYEDLAGMDGSFENGGGTLETIYFAPIEDFETIVGPPALGTGPTMADDIKIVGPHVMKTGKKFYAINLNYDGGQLDGAITGEIGGRSVTPNFEGIYIGDEEEAWGFQRIIKNGRYIFLVPLPSGKVAQIGTEERPARASMEWTSAKIEGLKAGTLTVQCVSNAMWSYTGDIPLTEAV